MRLDPGCARQGDAVQLAGIVGRLDAVDQRTARQRDAADILAHFGVGEEPGDRHVEVEFDAVAALPFALDRGIAVAGHAFQIDSGAIDLERRLAAPGRHAQVKRELGWRLSGSTRIEMAPSQG